MKSYCKFCGKAAGEPHEVWCPSNDEVRHDHEK